MQFICAVVAYSMRGQRFDGEYDCSRAQKLFGPDRRVRTRVSVKRSAIRVDHDNDFAMLPMVMITAHGTGKNHRDIHVPNRTDKIETRGRGDETAAASIAVSGSLTMRASSLPVI